MFFKSAVQFSILGNRRRNTRWEEGPFKLPLKILIPLIAKDTYKVVPSTLYFGNVAISTRFWKHKVHQQKQISLWLLFFLSILLANNCNVDIYQSLYRPSMYCLPFWERTSFLFLHLNTRAKLMPLFILIKCVILR